MHANNKRLAVMVGAAAGILAVVLLVDARLSQSRFSATFVKETNQPVSASDSQQHLVSDEERQELESALSEARHLLDEYRAEFIDAQEQDNQWRGEIDSMLEQWTKSWSQQDAGSYLSFYAQSFDTPYQLSREEWAGFRIERIEEPDWVRVKIDEVDIVQMREDFAALTLTQYYASPGYADRTRKHIDLVRENGVWKIQRERSVETERTK